MVKFTILLMFFGFRQEIAEFARHTAYRPHTTGTAINDPALASAMPPSPSMDRKRPRDSNHGQFDLMGRHNKQPRQDELEPPMLDHVPQVHFNYHPFPQAGEMQPVEAGPSSYLNAHTTNSAAGMSLDGQLSNAGWEMPNTYGIDPSNHQQHTVHSTQSLDLNSFVDLRAQTSHSESFTHAGSTEHTHPSYIYFDRMSGTQFSGQDQYDPTNLFDSNQDG
jgi:hypothetical protein